MLKTEIWHWIKIKLCNRNSDQIWLPLSLNDYRDLTKYSVLNSITLSRVFKELHVLPEKGGYYWRQVPPLCSISHHPLLIYWVLLHCQWYCADITQTNKIHKKGSIHNLILTGLQFLYIQFCYMSSVKMLNFIHLIYINILVL